VGRCAELLADPLFSLAAPSLRPEPGDFAPPEAGDCDRAALLPEPLPVAGPDTPPGLLTWRPVLGLCPAGWRLGLCD